MASLANRPIGVFDSGIGGLTVVKQIIQMLPHEDIIYFGDIARLPYGTKSVATIRKFARQSAEFLLKQNVKAIIIACNTISAVAKDEVESLALNIPVIDVISAASKVIRAQSKTIGIIATPATVNSNAYPDAIKDLNPQAKVLQEACSLFVPFIEEGYIDHPALELIAREYLENLINAHIDTLILGCTHYPLIKSTLAKIITNNVLIIDPAYATSKELVSCLENMQELNTQHANGNYKFYVTELSKQMTKIGEMLLNIKLNTPQLVNLD